MNNVAKVVAAAVALVGAAAMPAQADSPVSTRVLDEGRHVLVEVTGLASKASEASSRSDRIEIPVANGLAHGGKLEVADKTIKRVYFEPGRPAMVSIQMRHGLATTARLASHSVIEQHGDTLRIRVPRRRRHITDSTPEAPVELDTELVDGPARAIEPPVAAPEPEAMVAATAEPVAAEPVAAEPVAAQPRTPTARAAKAPEAPAAAATTAVPQAAAETPAAAAAAAAPARDAERTVAALGDTAAKDDRDGTAASVDAEAAPAIGGATGGGGSLGLVIVILAACAGAAWFARRRSQNAPAGEPVLSIIAEKSLGAKAKVVLMSAGDREILLSVGDKDGPQLLGQWASGDSRPPIAEGLEPVSSPANANEIESAQDKLAALRRAAFGTSKQPVVGGPNFAASLDRVRSSYAGTENKASAPTVNVQSPSIAGLLKLRGGQPVLSQDMTSSDPEADAEWAAELLAATAARGGRN